MRGRAGAFALPAGGVAALILLRTFALVSHVDPESLQNLSLGLGYLRRKGLSGAVDGDGRRLQGS